MNKPIIDFKTSTQEGWEMFREKSMEMSELHRILLERNDREMKENMDFMYSVVSKMKERMYQNDVDNRDNLK